MNSLSFPDVNVWFAVLLEDHVHHTIAGAWWNADESGNIIFSRFTQLGLLRLLTTSAAMNGRPRTMAQAWDAYERLFEDARVAFYAEPVRLDPTFRRLSSSKKASPKVWADAYMLAFADAIDATLLTFDRGIVNRGVQCLVLGSSN